MKKALVCSVCGYVHLKETAPEKCPVCGAPAKVFALKDEALKTENDIVTVGESHKKHLPVLFTKLMQCCNDSVSASNSDGQCSEIKAKVGETVHPMTPEHYITRIVFYTDNEYAGHVSLTPQLKPLGSVSLSLGGKKISAVAQCNIHGNWITSL